MQRLVSGLIALAMTLGSLAARAAGDTKAAELLAQARAALGGEKQLAKVEGLACTGTVQRAIGDRHVTGDVTINLQLPDKMLRSDSISPMGDAALVVTDQGINGDKLLRNMRTINTPPGAVVRTPPPPAPGSDAEAQALRNSRAELARMTIALLLAAPSGVPVEFTYAGEAEAPEGKADVLDVKASGATTGSTSFAAKLFLDKSNHRPLMLAYRGLAPRVVVQAQRGAAPPPEAHTAQPAAPAPEMVDITMFFDEYKAIEGVLLPHRVTRSVGGETIEELTFKSVKVNPQFRPDAFQTDK